MPIEALAWSLILLLSPALTVHFWPSLQERFEPLPIDMKNWAPWIHSLGIPYLAIIMGSVSGRKIGLYGQEAVQWLIGILACAFGVIAAAILGNHREKRPNPEVDFQTNLLEETRWAFYRGAAALWLPGTYFPLLGFGLAMIEFGIWHGLEFGRQPPTAAGWKVIMRAAFSTLLFFITGNFWLTAATQLLLNTGLTKRSSNQGAL